MTKEECNKLRDELNTIHKKLLQKPDKLKYGFWREPHSILNAYREGDITIKRAVEELNQLKNL